MTVAPLPIAFNGNPVPLLKSIAQVRGVVCERDIRGAVSWIRLATTFRKRKPATHDESDPSYTWSRPCL